MSGNARRLTRSLSRMASEILEGYDIPNGEETKEHVEETDEELLSRAIQLSLANWENQQEQQQQQPQPPPRSLLRSQVSVDSMTVPRETTTPEAWPEAWPEEEKIKETEAVPMNTMVFQWGTTTPTSTMQRINKFDPVPIVDVVGNSKISFGLTATVSFFYYQKREKRGIHSIFYKTPQHCDLSFFFYLLLSSSSSFCCFFLLLPSSPSFSFFLLTS